MARSTGHQSVAIFAFLSLLTAGGIISCRPATAAIYRWDNGELITEMDPEPGVDFAGVDLSYPDLTGAPLSGAVIILSDLSHAHLIDADLTGAIIGVGTLITDAVFSGANLADADFALAVATNVDFRGTRLTRTAMMPT